MMNIYIMQMNHVVYKYTVQTIKTSTHREKDNMQRNIILLMH